MFGVGLPIEFGEYWISRKFDSMKPSSLEITANREAQKWSRKELLGRLVWECSRFILFSVSPRQFWGWRRLILRLFGAKIGADVRIAPSVKIAIPWNLRIGDETAVGDCAILYSLGVITLGQRVTISQNAHLCAGSHDFDSTKMELTKPPVTIDDDVWVCADAFIGPGVILSRRSIAGARAVVTRDVPSDVIVAGNPAREIKKRNLG